MLLEFLVSLGLLVTHGAVGYCCYKFGKSRTKGT